MQTGYINDLFLQFLCLCDKQNIPKLLLAMRNNDIKSVNGMSPSEKEPCTILKEGEKPKEAPEVCHN